METLGFIGPKINTVSNNTLNANVTTIQAENLSRSKSITDKIDIPFFTKQDVFSNFYECKFDIDNYIYSTTEQYLFSQKALFVGDIDNGEKIKRNRDARTCKIIGEQNVKWPGSLEDWRSFATDKLRTANLAKYSQNEGLRRILFSTHPNTLVETNPQ